MSQDANAKPPATEVLLSAEGVTRRFGRFTALEGASLELRRGEIHALIGPNGAGKTTLVDALSGRLPAGRSGGGKVSLLGRDATRAPAWARARRGLGRSFQRSRLFPRLSAAENLRLALAGRAPSFRERLRSGGPARLAEARRQLALAGLEGREDLPVSALSHGERRALELAMAFAGGAEVVLLDEPLAGLGAGESLHEAIRRYAAGRAVLLIEHDLAAVFALADRITVLAGGRVIGSGTADEIRADPAVREAYLPQSAPMPS